MKFYILFCVILKFYMGASIEIRPELQRNILNFGYGINYKYEGMLVHLFDRFYVVTKFMLPTIGDLKFSKLDFDYTCAYMEKEYAPNMDSRKYMLELRAYCNKVKLTKLNDTMLMYGIYNVEMLEKLIKTVCKIHNTTSAHEKLFAGEHNHSIFRILYTHSLGLQHYSTNSLLYLRIIQDKYISLYRELITQLHTYMSAIRILERIFA